MTIEAELYGATYELRTGLQSDIPNKEMDMFVTINVDKNGNIYEIFVRAESKEYFEALNLVTRLVSMALRAAVDPMTIAKELQEVYSMTSQHIIPGTTDLCPSIIARIGLILEHEINRLKIRR